MIRATISDIHSPTNLDDSHEFVSRNLAHPDSCFLQVGPNLSYLGRHLVARIEVNQGNARLITRNEVIELKSHEILNVLFQTESEVTTPLAFGYISYEFLHSIEDVTPVRQASIPVMCFSLFSRVFHIEADTVKEIHIAWHLEDEELQEFETKEPTRLPSSEKGESLLAALAKSELPDILGSNFTAAGYRTAIEEIKEEILNGEVYQVNLSQQLSFKWPYNQKKIINNFLDQTAPYKAFLHQTSGRKGFKIISISPELFFAVGNNQICTRPIKGTRPRGKTKSQDEALKRELLESSKDRAELAMIVDLLRNDLSRVCKVDSVRVGEFPELASLQHVYHTFCDVVGELKNDCALLDILNALFPCGSITGAPKIAAMQIISDFEQRARGPYCGAIGYIGSNGTASFNVAIRTVLFEEPDDHLGSRVTLNSGGGITLKSDPNEEYQETLDKLRGLFALLSY